MDLQNTCKAIRAHDIKDWSYLVRGKLAGSVGYKSTLTRVQLGGSSEWHVPL